MKKIILFLLILFSTSFFGQPGTIDPSFNSTDLGFGNNSGPTDGNFNSSLASSGVYSSALQTDGKIILVGDFVEFNGVSKSKIVRLNPDGSIDNSFNIGTGANSRVIDVDIQNDGKIIIVGNFSLFNGTTKGRIVRLNSDGTIDNSFNMGSGFNGNTGFEARKVKVLSNQQIIVNGNFTSYNGTSKNEIVKINSDGTLDNTFSTNFTISQTIWDFDIQNDGKLIVCGSFVYGGRNNVVRLNSNGSLDATFNQLTTGFVGADLNVRRLIILPGGKIIIHGSFTSYNGVTRKYVARINSDGSLDNSFNLGIVNSSDSYTFTIQNDGKMIIRGTTFSYNGTPINTIARLNSDYTIDNSFILGNGITGTNENIYTISRQFDGKYIIGGVFGSFNDSFKNNIVRLNEDGSVDNSFNMGTGANNVILCTTIQSDGKIITGGRFSSVNGNTTEKISRLNTDGTFDISFNTGNGANGVVQSILCQNDGKIIIGGDFTSFSGLNINRIVRLNSNGTIDNTFNSGTGANGIIRNVNIQPDGKIIIGGNFTTYNGIARSRIARLNSNGTLDTTFNSGVSGPNADVISTLIQSDGKIIISGNFTFYNGFQSNGILRLNNNGSIDGTFNVGLGTNGSILATALQSDGKIIIGGSFTTFNGGYINNIARLNTNGTLDNSFNIGDGVQGFNNNYVYAISLENNGNVIIGGYFSLYNGIARSNIARLNTNGTLDTFFNVGLGSNYIVRSTSIQSDGKIIIGGDFTSYNGIGRNRIARINGGVALSNPSFDLSTDVIYPNPSNGNFTLQINNIIGTENIEIYTLMGQKIYSKSIVENESSIDVSNQPKGIYFYKISDNYKVIKSGKLIIE
jgi:uncharacterized delta-60 repeat protein